MRGPSLGVKDWVKERVAPMVEGGVDHDSVLRRRSSSTSWRRRRRRRRRRMTP